MKTIAPLVGDVVECANITGTQEVFDVLLDGIVVTWGSRLKFIPDGSYKVLAETAGTWWFTKIVPISRHRLRD